MTAVRIVGPWAIRMTKWDIPEVHNAVGIVCCLESDVDSHPDTTSYHETLMANARLIAAAPDLLAACASLLNIVDREVRDDNPIVVAARAAIAKAEAGS